MHNQISKTMFIGILSFFIFQLQKPAGKVRAQIAHIFRTETTQTHLMQLHHAN